MNYTTSNPWREMNELRREMNKLFDVSSRRTGAEYPAMNLWTNSENVLLTAELPGYEQKDVDITLLGDILRIHGSRNAPKSQENDCIHRQERRYGVFNREIKLPFQIDMSKIDAEFKDGILRVNLPRAEAAKPKKIEIKAN